MYLPNIMLLVLDTTRAKNLSCYGYPKDTSPNLDKIADEGILFTNAISNSSWTLPSHASLFTATYPSFHSVNNWTDSLSEDFVTMAQFFSSLGYQTVAINNNSWINEQFGLDRGFEVFKKIWLLFQTSNDLNITSRSIKHLKPLRKFIEVSKSIFKGNAVLNILNGVYGQFLYNSHDLGGKRIIKTFENWIHHERNKEKPFLLFINLLEPHLPYNPPQKFLARFLSDKITKKQIKSLNLDPLPYIAGTEEKAEIDFEILTALYDADINYLDSLIGSIYEVLAGTNLLEETILVIVADHGENLGEHGLMSHFYCLYDTLIHIPFIVRFPAELPKATKIAEIVQPSDIFPTLAALVGLENHLPVEQLEGRNVLDSNQVNDHRIAVSELLGVNPPLEVVAKKTGIPENELSKFDKKIVALRDKQYKYIQDSLGNEELYDVELDPHETRNIISARPDVHARFKQFKKSWDSRNVHIDEKRKLSRDSKLEVAVLKRLEALGYL
ncbi:MAG: sulfatase [bacterium]